MQNVVHVTHEAIQKIGGIGAVLHGLLTSKDYLAATGRNILIGPYWPGSGEGEHRLGKDAEVLYSSMDGIARSPMSDKLRGIEAAFHVQMIYGKRQFIDKQTNVSSTVEVLLIDVSRFNDQRAADFKFQLWDRFGIDSNRYQHVWDYEQYLRLAKPAIAAAWELGIAGQADPCIILSHEYMGLPTALAAIMEPASGNFRTIFHAHEVATMRRIVEAAPGHDTMFYNEMKRAVAAGHFVDDAFGDQLDYYKHALVKQAKYCDEIFAVGDYVLAEMRFMGRDFLTCDASVAYNGVPHWPLKIDGKLASRAKLKNYCQTLLGFEPDFLFTHVTRLVPSKGLWRDLRVLEQVEPLLRARNETAVLFTLSTEGPPRSRQDVRTMEAAYEWPVAHREGGTDLTGGEANYYVQVQAFNAKSRNVKVVFLNQFGFDTTTCGDRMSPDMEFMDIRQGSDVEFGQSIYEPFGIAQVEPISFGGICVYTNVCGCAGFVKHAAGGKETPNAIVADYTQLPDPRITERDAKHIGKPERETIERSVAKTVAKQIVDRLPRSTEELSAYLERGQKLAGNMSWDVVARDYVLPGFRRATQAHRLEPVA